MNQEFESYREIYHKKYKYNTNGGAKVAVLLELLEVLECKGRHISRELVRIGFNNCQNYRKLVNEIYHANMYV